MDAPAIDRATFLAGRGRVFGNANPQRMVVPHWEYMVRTGDDPYWIREHFGVDGPSGPGGKHHDPDWCFRRFGMPRVDLPDGRVLFIAGEHEDGYDPDFCIYNDLIVVRPPPGAAFVTPTEGQVEIYGYPPEVFPPTDFHSATLVGEHVYLIGSLGYVEDRARGPTPVFRLDTRDYRIERLSPTGDAPGWIYRHHASYDVAAHSIVVRGGRRLTGPDAVEPQRGVYRLRLDDLVWEKLRACETPRAYYVASTPRDAYEHPQPPLFALFRPPDLAHRYWAPGRWGTPVLDLSRCACDLDPPALLEIDGVPITIEAHEADDEFRVGIGGDLDPETVRRFFASAVSALASSTGVQWVVEETPADAADSWMGS